MRVVVRSGPRRWFQLYLGSAGMGTRDQLVQDAAARLGPGGGAAWSDAALATRSSARHLSHLEPCSDGAVRLALRANPAAPTPD